MLNINDQDRQVSKFLSDNNIKVAHQFIGYDSNVNGQDWKADRFLIKFKDTEFSFNVGIGNRLESSTKDKTALSELKAMYSNCNKVLYSVDHIPVKYDKTVRTLAVAPTPASVLFCLLSDAEASDYSFDDWCDMLGHSDDSLSALNIYKECCKIGKSLLKVFSRDQIEQLREMLQDY